MSNKKIAFITGANRGIGFETARELGEQGIEVVIGARDVKKGEEAVAKLKAAGIEAAAVRYDASDSSTEQAVYDFLDSHYGRLDILVNNAGIMSAEESVSGGGTVETVSIESVKETFDVNFFAVVSLTQKLLPLIKKSPEGRIVNLSSILGSLTLHSQPNSPIAGVVSFGYCSSKTALNAFTVHLAKVLRDTPIKVNSAHPGWVKTELGGDAAPLEVSEGGRTSVLLATIDEGGPTSGFFHLQDTLPW